MPLRQYLKEQIQQFLDIDKLQMENAVLSTKLQEKEALIQDLQRQLALKDQEIQNLQEKVNTSNLMTLDLIEWVDHNLDEVTEPSFSDNSIIAPHQIIHPSLCMHAQCVEPAALNYRCWQHEEQYWSECLFVQKED